jgi:hypothetical protein
MRRLASEVIRELEMRVARLERQASVKYTIAIGGTGRKGRSFRKVIPKTQLNKIRGILTDNISVLDLIGLSWREGKTSFDVHGSMASISIVGNLQNLSVDIIPSEPAVMRNEQSDLRDEMEVVLRHLNGIRF